MSPCLFPTTLTITPRAPPKSCRYYSQYYFGRHFSGRQLYETILPHPGFELGPPILFPTTRPLTLSVSMYVCTYRLRTSRMRHKVSFKRSLTGLYLEFSFSYPGCHTKVKKPYLPYYFQIAGWGRISGFIPFTGVLTQSEMQTAPSKIRT